MERDFTAKCYEDFCAMIDRINDENWCGITDWFGDCFWGLKHLLADWGLLDYTDKMDVYYKELLDRENTSKEHVTQVFEGVSTLDTSFADGNLDHFGYCRNYLKDFRLCLKGINDFVFSGQSGSISTDFSLDLVDAAMRKNLILLQYSSLPMPEHQFAASTFSKISWDDKAAYVNRCETLCPDLAKEVDLLFSDPDWTTSEKMGIKFMIYSAPEPYRFIFLYHSLPCRTILFQPGSEDSGHYTISGFSPEPRTIRLEDLDSNLYGHPQAPYYAVFHEFGHAADDSARQTERFLSFAFESNGNSLLGCITEDVRNYVTDYINSTDDYKSLTDEEKDLLLASLNLTGEPSPAYGGSTDGLPESLHSYREKIVAYMADDLVGETNSSASDIYGGVTNNAIVGTRGHKGEDQRYYWYNTKGNSTNRQTSELWAEFFGAQMTHDEESLASIKEHFPTAYPMLEEMARQMAAK